MTDRNFISELEANELAHISSQEQKHHSIPGAWQTEFSIEGPHDTHLLPIYQPSPTSALDDHANTHTKSMAARIKNDGDNKIIDGPAITLPSALGDGKHISSEAIPNPSPLYLLEDREPKAHDLAVDSECRKQKHNENNQVHPKRTLSLSQDFKFPLPKEPHPHPLRSHPVNIHRHPVAQSLNNTDYRLEMSENNSGIHPGFNTPAGSASPASRFSGECEQTSEQAMPVTFHHEREYMNGNGRDQEGEEENCYSPLAQPYPEAPQPPKRQISSIVRIDTNSNINKQSEDPLTPEQHSRAPANSFSVAGAQRFATSPDLRALESRIPWESPSPRAVKDDADINNTLAPLGKDADIALNRSVLTDRKNFIAQSNVDDSVGPVQSSVVEGLGAATEDANTGNGEKRSTENAKDKGKGKRMGGMIKDFMCKGREVMAGFAKQMKKGEMPWTQWYCCGKVDGVECEQMNHQIRKTCRHCKHPVCENCVKGTL